MIDYYVPEMLNLLEKRGESRDELAKLEWLWLAVLKHGRGPKALQATLSEHPGLFVDALKLIYRGKGETRREPTEQERLMGTHAYHMLNAWEQVPGAGPLPPGQPEFEGDIPFASGQVDESKLLAWVDEARRLAGASGRLEVCDSEIGRVLAYAPIGTDGAWPCEPVRVLLERPQTSEIRKGVVLGVFNKRGVVRREKGGDQERAIVAKFQRWQEQVTVQWPATGRMLGEIAHQYAGYAKMEDERSMIEEYEP
jgi:hypothetical protein